VFEARIVALTGLGNSDCPRRNQKKTKAGGHSLGTADTAPLCFIGRILKGAKPAEPTRDAADEKQPVISLTTDKAFGSRRRQHGHRMTGFFTSADA
jgi:hypothetical protein